MPGALPLCACEVVLTTSAPSRTLLEPWMEISADAAGAAAAARRARELEFLESCLMFGEAGD